MGSYHRGIVIDGNSEAFFWVKKMESRLVELGYSDITDFHRKSGVADMLSHETVRRVFGHGKPVLIETWIKVATHLDFSPAEVADMCRALKDDFWPDILSASEHSVQLVRMVEVVEQVLEEKPDLRPDFDAMMDLLVRASGIEKDKAQNLSGPQG